jgi:hypothetical protein
MIISKNVKVVQRNEMEYDKIPRYISRHIPYSYYNQSSPEIRQILIENGNELHTQFKQRPYIVNEQGVRYPYVVDDKVEIKFYAVGMRFNGDHVFTMDDDIRLEKEDDNPHDSNAIKVMVNGVHKAYVSKLDNKTIRCVTDFEHKKVKLIANYSTCSSMNLIVS